MVHEDLAASVTSLGETCYSAERVSVEVTTSSSTHMVLSFRRTNYSMISWLLLPTKIEIKSPRHTLSFKLELRQI